MGKWLRSITAGLVANLLFWGVPLLVALLAWLQSVPWYIIALSTIIAFGAILWGYNQLDVFLERRKKGFSSQSDEQIMKTLEGWLLKQGHGIREDPQPNALFQFGATSLQGKMVIISRYKDLPNLIRIWVHFIIPQYALDRFNALPEPIREEIMQQCQIEMARQGVQWEGISSPLGDVKLHYFMRCDDSLTEFNFLNGVVFMVNSQVLLHATMALLIKQAERNVNNVKKSGSHMGDSQA